jgi:hypothetical protein
MVAERLRITEDDGLETIESSSLAFDNRFT